MYKSLKDVYVSEAYARPVPPPYMRYVPANLLNEGGAGGSMTHPYDIPSVTNGKDLIEVFEDAVTAIQSERPAVKIDGVNVSIKIARDINGKVHRDRNGKMQFGIDRGAKNNELDKRGVTIDELGKRFISKDPTQQHGLIEAGAIVLDIFNTALPYMENELKELDFFDKEHQHFFNMEYVYGQTNVVGYNGNFLAIHGVNSINTKTREKEGEVEYNKNTLEKIVEIVRPIAIKSGFKVYSTIPAELPEGVEQVDFSPALNSELTVLYTPDHAVTKLLSTWLNEAKSPKGRDIALIDNKKISPFSRKNYDNVTGRVPLNSIIKDNNEIKRAIDGAVFIQATILMGQILKNSLQSEIGHVGAHEGVVVRNLIFKGKKIGEPIKFTGDFIIGKEQGKFAKSQDNNEYGSPIIPTSNQYTNPGPNTTFAYSNYDNRDLSTVPTDLHGAND
jgi:hypothetical protein